MNNFKNVAFDLSELAVSLRDFYLSRGFSDSKYILEFEKWCIKVLEGRIEKIEDCFVKTSHISFYFLTERYRSLFFCFTLSSLLNIVLLVLLVI